MKKLSSIIFSDKDIKQNIINAVLFITAICQFAIILFFNIFEARTHLGIDSSWDYLKTAVVANSGSIYPTSLLSETTAPLIDRLFIFALPLYKITGNIWISYAIANLITTALIIILIYKILKIKECSFTSFLVVLNLFLCPYQLNEFSWMNDLGYFSCIHVMASVYSFRILGMLLAYRILLIDKINKKEIALIAVSILLSVLFGIGSGMSMIAMFFLPLLLSRIVLTFINNDWAFLKNKKSLFVYASIISVGVGRVLGGALGLTYKDAIENWISADGFWSNLGNEIVAFMLLLGAIPEAGVERSPMSLAGLSHVFGLVIFVAIVISLFFVIVSLVKSAKAKELDEFWATLVTVVLATILEFSLLDTTYGDPTFEKRYLLTALVTGFFFVAFFINKTDKDSLFRGFCILVVTGAIILIDLVSDYNYKKQGSDEFQMEAMVDVIDSTDAGLVYAYGDNTIIYERCIRVMDLDRYYKQIRDDGSLNNWGDYRYYDDSTQYVGPTILMVDVDGKKPSDEIMSKYQLLDTIHNISIYYSKDNPIDLEDI